MAWLDRAAVLGLGWFGLLSCQLPARTIELVMDTDAPMSRPMDLTILAAPGVISVSEISARTMDPSRLLRLAREPNGEGTLRMPGSVSLVPTATTREMNDQVTVWIRARFAATTTAPETLVERVAHLRFLRGPSVARLFFSLRCGERAADCTSVSAAQCTVSVRCVELGSTCGDLGECVAPVIPTVEPTRPREDLEALTVRNTQPMGPGSLMAAVDTLNTRCAELRDPTVRFAIPASDPGVVRENRQQFWRISSLPSVVIRCPGARLDGTSQAAAMGNSNTATFGDRPVGAMRVRLPVIQGPEIDLQNTTLQIEAPDVLVRGLAFRNFTTFGAHRGRIEQCVIGSEPTRVGSTQTQAAQSRIDESSAFSLTESLVLVQSTGARDINGLNIVSPNVVLRDNEFHGVVTTVIFDLVHLNPVQSPSIVHNYFASTGWEYLVEWVGGTGTRAMTGQITENTSSSMQRLVRYLNTSPMTESGNVTE
ncbi:MAG: hypothetical protein Q8Q09_06995 [Deltaproteobacteria bacterium]|nr:hypothetical protein [Deltaproteobacteria bacterium]